MTDLSLVFTGQETDLSLALDDINTDEGLETAVSISLFTDRRASNDDVIPDGTDNKRGCWIDSYPEVEGDLIGSRLWLLFREKTQQGVINRAKAFIAEALQWMMDDGVVSEIQTDARFMEREILQIILFIVRPGGDEINLQFEINWRQQALKH